MRIFYLYKFFTRIKGIKKALAVSVFICCCSSSSFAQCPPNIDFESGDFTGWQCYTGTFSMGNLILNPTPPTANRHEIIPGNLPFLVDPYGNFPQHCPNGSNYSVKLGNNSAGGEAERVSYTFTIPPTQNQFSLIYNYAMVLNDGGHPTNIQPRLTIEVKNLTDNTIDPCSSFDIAIGIGGLPGFILSSTPNVYYRNWAANSINLDGNAGKTIRVSFTTTDCGQTVHFGYAYIDVNTECSSSFIGAAYCPDDTSVNVTAPFGYQSYEWWNSTFTTVLGNTQTINFTPPPPAGTQVAVILDPFSGYGCRDTLYADLLDTLNVFANAGPDKLSCQNAPVQVGVNPSPGFVYSWSPTTDLSNPNISNPIATPSVTTQYVLTVRNFGGGCLTTDTVLVRAAVLDNSISQTGISEYCLGDTAGAVLKVNLADSIQWYRNNVAIPGANDTLYRVVQTGTYHATVFSFVGCNLTTTDIDIVVNPLPVVDFSTNALDQCFNNHQFVFTNSTTISYGTMLYNWDLGDGTLLTTQNVTHTYALPGTYIVKLKVVSDKGCTDSISYTVHVFDSPVSGFVSNIRALCFKNNRFIFFNSSTMAVGTMKYNWNFGDGDSDTTRDVTHVYAAPGTYTVRLTVTSDKGCPNDSAFDITVHPEPVVAFTEPNAQQCFGNNQFNFINGSTILTGSMQYLWSLGDGATAVTTDVTHSYAVPGDYTVKLVALSDKGCTDSTSSNVKIFKYAIADFKVEPICVNLRLPLFNQTVNTSPSILTYLWEFGNGQTSTLQNPVYSYPAPGNYPIKLTVSNIYCPQTFSVKQLTVDIDASIAGIRYPDVEAVMNFPEQLQARQIASTVLWTPSISLDFSTSYRPSFKGLASQLYQVQLKTRTGCLTVDTQFVKIKKKIEIYVPTAFTPDGNGKNEYLYPVLMGFKKLNYFRVYDRWGKMLFQSQTERPGWDGRVNGEKQTTKTVVWMVEAVDVDGVTHKRQGTTVLLQ